LSRLKCTLRYVTRPESHQQATWEAMSDKGISWQVDNDLLSVTTGMDSFVVPIKLLISIRIEKQASQEGALDG